jgi:hypothetical protein
MVGMDRGGRCGSRAQLLTAIGEACVVHATIISSLPRLCRLASTKPSALCHCRQPTLLSNIRHEEQACVGGL